MNKGSTYKGRKRTKTYGQDLTCEHTGKSKMKP